MEETAKKVETKASNIIMAMVTKEVTKEETQWVVDNLKVANQVTSTMVQESLPAAAVVATQATWSCSSDQFDDLSH